MKNPTVILKHYRVVIAWRDGSRTTWELDDQAQVQRYIEQLNLSDTDTVSISPVWSRPGESVPLVVHQQGEDNRRIELARTNDRERQNDQERKKRDRTDERKLRTAYDVEQTMLGFPPAE